MTEFARRSARVLLLDGSDRVLLVMSGDAWLVPGGGVEDGRADLGWASGLFRDDFFLYRVASHQVDASGLNEFERQYYRGHRWWTQAELAATRETVYRTTWLPWSPT